MSKFIPARASRGFTLIELMIVVAVVAILAAIAYPSYTEYVRKANRAQAKADLLELAQLAERSHTVNNSYADFEIPDALQHSPRESDGTAVKYNVGFAVDPTQSAYTLQAVPANAQAEDRCGTLTLNQAGAKGNSEGTLDDCW